MAFLWVFLWMAPFHGLHRRIYAELTGYGANSDGYDVVAPSGVGGEKCRLVVTG